MRAIRLCSLGLALLLPLASGAWAAPLAAGGGYVAPLEASAGLTSGFGEFRNGHFHAGLDYSTDQVEGKPVRAILDGWVERVRASGVGYGRAIYLRLADGRTAVYGHLSRFAPALDAYVAARQESAGVYEQDLYPQAGEIAFRRGDLIAWSGQSGAGPPHLHFELRQGDVNLNPLLKGFALPDSVPPALAAARLTHAEGLRPAEVSVTALHPGGAAVSAPVRSPFTISLKTWDTASGRPNRLATWRLEAMLDGRPAFDAVLDSISWDDAVEVECVYDYARTLAGQDDWRTLELLSTYHAGVIRRGPAVWALTPGTHRFVFTATDEAGHRTTRALDVPVLASDSVSGAGRDTAGVARGVPAAACTLSVVAPGLLAQCAIPSGALFAPELLSYAPGGPAPPAAGLEPLSGAIDFGPHDVVLRTAARFSGRFSGEASAALFPRGLFLRQERAWSLVGALDSLGRFDGSSRRLGAVAVFADTTRPTIVPPTSYRWPARKSGANLPAVSAAIKDRGAGLSAREQSIFVDGRRVPAEYDSEAGRLTWRPRAGLAPGRHSVRIEAVDRLGNRAVATVPLEVE
ncbi:MAG: M23 family metallopeptidase [Candidatus Eisenbacteria bacterium]